LRDIFGTYTIDLHNYVADKPVMGAIAYKVSILLHIIFPVHISGLLDDMPWSCRGACIWLKYDWPKVRGAVYRPGRPRSHAPLAPFTTPLVLVSCRKAFRQSAQTLLLLWLTVRVVMTEKLAEDSLSGIKEKMAGEVVFSAHPGRTLRKWRKDFEVSQTELARFMKTVPSVVADYEADRRASPGAHFIKRYVDALIAVDMERGGRIVKQFAPAHLADGILGIREFSVSVPLKLFSEMIEATRVSNIDIQRDIHGYSLIDAPRAILSLGAHEFVQIYGWTTQRALIFTGMKYGRSPMVAIRAHLLKPAAVVYAGTRKVDPLAIRLSEVENIPLLITSLGPNEIMKRLEEM